MIAENVVGTVSRTACAPRALIVEDDGGQRDALRRLVEREGFVCRGAGSLEHARRALGRDDFDLLLTDLRLPDGLALDLLPVLGEHPDTELVFVTAHATVDTAVDALRRGAVDYMTKPLDVTRLRTRLAKVKRSVASRSAMRSRASDAGRLGCIVGGSAAMRCVYERILKVSPTDATVLVVGETGTGKELVARALHDLSGRSDGPLVSVNCGAISGELIESELFGHEKGSFTGALRSHAGFFEQADGGTLFLDEITEMPLDLQVRLLRVLETRTVRRVGSEEAVGVDVRLVAATNRDPRQAVAEGRLRQDLLYRLLVFEIPLPPLRERRDDVVLLAHHFLALLNREADTRKRLTRAAIDRLRTHAWPGNVRELAHALECAFILADEEIDVEHLPFTREGTLRAAPGGVEDSDPGVRIGMSAAEAERLLTLATLDRYKEKKRTAEVLGVSLKTLYNRLKTYRIS